MTCLMRRHLTAKTKEKMRKRRKKKQLTQTWMRKIEMKTLTINRMDGIVQFTVKLFQINHCHNKTMLIIHSA